MDINLRRFPRVRALALKPVGVYWRLRERYFQDYLFIHINKTGGRSIETALGCIYEHKTARQKRREIGAEVWDDKFTFTFVRNPWDRLVSQYFYRRQTNQGAEDLEFQEWVRRVYAERDPELRSREVLFLPQSDWVTDDEGNALVDFVGRFERFEDHFQYVCDRLDVRKSLPHKNKSSRETYQTYYTNDTAEIVAEYFAEDIERFDYSF
jgi:hypothetical protein